MGLYLLIADDDWPYKSETEWVPQLPDYMESVNTLWLAFVHPEKMPALPPAMQYIGLNRTGVAPGTKVIASIGGQAYSQNPSTWSWLSSVDKAEAMAEQVVQWKQKYGIDGVDLDIEEGAGNPPESGSNAVAFARKLKQLDPEFIVTQPVYGFPSVNEEEYVTNECFKNGADGTVSAIGIMTYEGTASLQYVKNYAHGTSQWDGFPIKVDVPTKNILLGAGGQSSTGDITTLATQAKKQDLRGIMVWYASVIDTATGQVGNQYGGGRMDSSAQGAAQKAAWKQALDIMTGSSAEALV